MERSGLILVVEDEEDIRNLLLARLEKEGFRVEGIADGAEAIHRAPILAPACVVLDLMLPGAPGTAVCRALRAHPTTRAVPILMLTARGEEADRVAGFELGADDYVSKPFSMRELIVRIRALLRRAASPGEVDGQLHFGTLEIDYRTHRVWVENAEVVLTDTEFRLLGALTRNGSAVLTRRQLLDKMWDKPSDLDARTVDAHVRHLREKLGPLGNRIETVHGVGYRFGTSTSPAPEE